MFISNYDNYSAIGMGSLFNDKQSVNIAYADSDDRNEKYLIGLTKDGKIEKVKFIKTIDENGKEVEQEWRISNFHAFNKLSFIEYTSSRFGRGDNSFVCTTNKETDYLSYVLDNETGKLYSINEINEEVILFEDMSYTHDGMESEKSVYFYSSKYGEIYTFYRASIQNGELVIEEVYKNDDNMVELNIKSTFVDKYDNVYISKISPEYNSDENLTTCQVEYIIKSDNTMERVDKKMFLSINKIAYTYDCEYFVDENGEFQNNTFAGCKLFLEQDILVKKDSNVEYYYGLPEYKKGIFQYGGSNTSNFPNYYLKRKIYKVNWINDIEFTYEIIDVEGVTIEYENFVVNIPSHVATQDRIYFYDDLEIFYVNIIDGKKHSLVSDYYFLSIETDNLGRVSFKALNQNRNEVFGIIDNDGNVVTLTKEAEYNVYYIKPIN